MASVGSVADPVASAYGVSLAFVGLLTTALLLTHFAAQLPAGREIDRRGALTVALAAIALCAVGNALALVAPSPWLAIVARLVTGLGSGAGFVAGADAMRSTGLSLTWQGAYGSATMAGGGLAVLVTPQLVGELGWRAPYWTGLGTALVVGLAVLAAPRVPTVSGHRRALLVDRRLLPLGAIHASTFGLVYVAGAWVVPLLERHGIARRDAAIAGALILLGGIVTRPLGGVAAARWPGRAREIVAGSIVLAAAGCAALALPLPLVGSAAAALVCGVAGGLPFALVFGSAQRLRADAPGAALAFVNVWAILALVVGTPLVGLGFELPGDGRTAFVLLGLASLAALPAVRRAPLRAQVADP